jgi:hypothetical protein
MPQYAAVLAGNVTARWTQKGYQQERNALSYTPTANAEQGWRLHSLPEGHRAPD